MVSFNCTLNTTRGTQNNKQRNFQLFMGLRTTRACQKKHNAPTPMKRGNRPTKHTNTTTSYTNKTIIRRDKRKQ